MIRLDVDEAGLYDKMVLNSIYGNAGHIDHNLSMENVKEICRKHPTRNILNLHLEVGQKENAKSVLNSSSIMHHLKHRIWHKTL